MKEKFEALELDVVRFESEDIMTVSGVNDNLGDDCLNQTTPIGPCSLSGR